MACLAAARRAAYRGEKASANIGSVGIIASRIKSGGTHQAARQA